MSEKPTFPDGKEIAAWYCCSGTSMREYLVGIDIGGKTVPSMMKIVDITGAELRMVYCPRCGSTAIVPKKDAE